MGHSPCLPILLKHFDDMVQENIHIKNFHHYFPQVSASRGAHHRVYNTIKETLLTHPKSSKRWAQCWGVYRQASNALMPSGRLSFHRQHSDPTALLTYLADDTWTHVHFIRLNCKSLGFCGRPLNIMPRVLRKPHHIWPLSDWKSQSYAVGKLLSWGIFVSFSRGEVGCFLGNERPSAFASKAFQFK